MYEVSGRNDARERYHTLAGADHSESRYNFSGHEKNKGIPASRKARTPLFSMPLPDGYGFGAGRLICFFAVEAASTASTLGVQKSGFDAANSLET